MPEEDRGLTGRIGPVEVDWPQAMGYYGGIALAISLGMIEPPLAIFIGAVPFFKMLNQPNSSLPSRFLGQLLEGAAKPVGGDGEAAVRMRRSVGSAGSRGFQRLTHETGSIWMDAKAIARTK